MKITLELDQNEQSAGLLSLISEFLKGGAPQTDERDTKGSTKSKTTKQNTKSKIAEPKEDVENGFKPQYDKVDNDEVEEKATEALSEKELRANIANKLTKLFRTHKEVVKEEILKYNVTKVSDMKSDDLIGFDEFLQSLLDEVEML